MRPIPKIDTDEIADFKAVELGISDPEKLAQDTLALIKPGESSQSSPEAELAKAFNQWMTGPESSRHNGIHPNSNERDREKILRNWRAHSIGDEMTLKRSSDLAEREEIPEEVKKEAESLGEWIADTYEGRGSRHRNLSTYRNLGNVQLESNLGILDDEEDALRIPKLNEIDEEDVIDSAIRLLESEAEETQIIQQGEQVKTREVDLGTAQEIIDENPDQMIEDASSFYNSVLEESANQVRDETGIQFRDLKPFEYLELLSNSDLEPGYSFEDRIIELLEQGFDKEETYADAKVYAANKVSDESGLIFPLKMDADQFLEDLDGLELTEVEVEGIIREKAIEEAEEISDTKQLSGDAFEAVRDLDEGEIYRDTDENDKRVYRWSQGSSYSVTTIINPLPTSYKEIDTGGGLFHWQNIYDGSDGKYDSDIIRDYSGNRGTLAHEEIFARYVEDEGEVRGDTQRYYNQLREIQPGEDDLGDLRDILEWKEDNQDRVLRYTENDEGYVQNGRDLAEKEISWIKEKFMDLEEDLGLTKDNVIYAEQEFAMNAVHPWDQSNNIKGPDIGEFSYGGTTDLIYEHSETGETILLDLKTGSMKPNYAIQQAAYKHAVENSKFFDDPRVKDGIDRVVVPEIDPEKMMYTEKEPIIHTDQPVDNNCYKTSEFLDASKVSLESSEYRKNRWRPENWHEEALYLFARAAEQMPLDP